METTSSDNSINSSSSNIVSVSRNIEDFEMGVPKSRQRNGGKQQDRCVLVDITNDSPIVGVANSGNLETPLSFTAKQRGSRVKNTPGSGEALLRGQVKSLLQKVEEEAELSKLSLESRPFLQLVNSPMALLAPTPANTPQVPNLSGDGGLSSLTPSPIVEEQLISQVVYSIFDGKNHENVDSEKSVITRSLLMDFSEKSEIIDASECSSELTYQELGSKEKPTTEDDVSSVWSIQANASMHDEDEAEIADIEEEEEEEEEEHYEDIEEEEEDLEMLDELCKGLNNVSVHERVEIKFAGKHTRFIYNSDDELVDEQEEESASASPNVLRLKGLPTPKGKHLRFPEEDEE